jgi:hypothetical protein
MDGVMEPVNLPALEKAALVRYAGEVGLPTEPDVRKGAAKVGESRATDNTVSWQALLGYLNFSEGRPDARFQAQLNEAHRQAAEQGEPVPTLAAAMRSQLAALRASSASAFRDTRQVENVLTLVFDRLLPAFRAHHADLLAHLGDRDLFQPFLLARAFEAVLLQSGPWIEHERVVSGALTRLNDFVGHRPIAVLESRPRGEPYDHERVRPVPLYLRGAGVSWGRYHDLLSGALEVLQATDPEILSSAQFDPSLLDELAFDPRAYDHNHPANRRATHLFGEWDPHHMDNQGRYRRFVVRHLVLEALLDRVAHGSEGTPQERLREASIVLAGIILMASGICGSSATSYDSTVTLRILVEQVVPRYREAFYAQLLEKTGGPHGDRLREEVKALRQPFGGARQALNQFVARHRASQQQERHLALLFAEMGYPEASRQHAGRIPTPALRLLSEILIRLSQGQFLTERGRLADAAALLPEAEDLLQRGIRCGAFADPWNILGFQGLYPLSPAREDSIRDPRIDELIDVVERQFDLYSRLLGEAAAAGDDELKRTLGQRMGRLATWWDQFASVSVGDVRRVHGGEATDAAQHVAEALARWHQQGEATAGPGFWRQHLRDFHSPKAFALVVDALLRKRDHRASLALLMNWLSQAEQAPLEDGDFSFHALALRWLHAVLGPRGESGGDPVLVRKFFDYLEANADENWEVPQLERSTPEEAEEDEEDDPYRAAYEDVTYQDSTDDGQEGAVIDDAPVGKDFDLEQDARWIEKRLRFLSTVARLWGLAARHMPADASGPLREAAAAWLTRAQQNRQRLLLLLDAIHETPIPQPLGTHESLVEFDRRRSIKEQLLEAAIGTCLDTVLAVRALQGSQARGKSATEARSSAAVKPWEPFLLRLEQGLLRGDVDEVRRELPGFVEQFHQEPLLFVPLSSGGHPTAILNARIAQAVLQLLVEQLPRLGLLRETYFLLRTARNMEDSPKRPPSVPMTEFDRLFQLGFQGVIESVVESARDWEETSDQALVALLENLTRPFLRLWIEHCKRLQMASVEKVGGAREWEELKAFIQQYGRDLFHTEFMGVLPNLRGVLHRGVEAYLNYLRDNPNPRRPVRLLDELDRTVPREQAVRCIESVLRAVSENWDEYSDYKTTTTLSDYGDNIYVLLDFLRLKAGYDRHAWQFRPLALVHEALARGGRTAAALLWQEAFTDLTRSLADQHLGELAQLEQAHAVRLRTVADRLNERFVKPLALDRLCVLVAPAMEAARSPDDDGQALARFQKELNVHAATPVGSGIDVPIWLRRLQREVQRVRAERTAITGLGRRQFLTPRTALSLAELRRQLAEWDKPFDEGPPARLPPPTN